MLMFLSPVHQSMGQIGGTMLIATGHTRVQVILGITLAAFSLVAAYIMMAPKDAPVPGFALASEGLAYKMVIMQFVHVNIVAWFIARIFGWKFEWGYQIVGLVMAVAASWLTKTMITGWAVGPILIKMAVAASIYLITVAGLLYLIPKIAGLAREELGALYKFRS